MCVSRNERTDHSMRPYFLLTLELFKNVGQKSMTFLETQMTQELYRILSYLHYSSLLVSSFC